MQKGNIMDVIGELVVDLLELVLWIFKSKAFWAIISIITTVSAGYGIYHAWPFIKPLINNIIGT